MNTVFRNCALALVILAVMTATAPAQRGKRRTIPVPSSVENLTQYNWTKQQWEGDNQPYQAIRAAIDKAIAAGQKPYALAQGYATAARLKPYDPQAQFRWAYATYKGYTANKKAREGLATLEDSRKLYQAKQALARPGSPHPYDYVRLRFLMATEHFPHRILKDLGRRLWHYNPTDTGVQLRLLNVLHRDPSTAQDRRDILAIAQDLQRRHPKEPNYYASVGGAYMVIWEKTKSRDHAAKAIAAYRRYLELAPPNAAFRKVAQSWIDYIQKRQRA